MTDNHYIALISLVAKILLIIFSLRYLRTTINLRYAIDRRVILMSLLIIIHSAYYNIDFDYFRYKEYYEGTEFRDTLESIYYVLFQIIPTYTLFRISLWGFGIIVFIKIYKIYGINPLLGLIFIAVYYLNRYSYARAPIACIVAIYGLCLLYENKNRKFSIPLLLLSCVMHKSIILFIAVYLLASKIRFNKKLIISLLIAIPLLPIALNYLINYVAVHFDIGLTSDSLSDILNGENHKGFSMSYFIGISSLVILLLIAIKQNIELKAKLPKSLRYLFNGTLLMIIICISLLFIPQGYMNLAVKRYLNLAMIPLLIFASHAYSLSSNVKPVRVLSLIQGIYIIVYNIYLFNHVDFSEII